MAHSNTIEDYLKAIYHLSETSDWKVSTNALASYLDIKSPTVSDMLGKLQQKKLITYKKYYGVSLTKGGEQVAINIIRKHRIWEVFLHEKLEFGWEEVHEIAEQLEHIESVELTNRLEAFLGFPKFDPHGDPIPDQNGKIKERKAVCFLKDLSIGENAIIVGVNDSSSDFLKYLKQQNLELGQELLVEDKFEFDDSLKVKLNSKVDLHLTKFVSENITVQKS